MTHMTSIDPERLRYLESFALGSANASILSYVKFLGGALGSALGSALSIHW